MRLTPVPPLALMPHPAGALLGARVAPWIDPAVAIMLSLWVVWAWGGQARAHILSLVGLSAPPALLQKLTWVLLLLECCSCYC